MTSASGRPIATNFSRGPDVSFRGEAEAPHSRARCLGRKWTLRRRASPIAPDRPSTVVFATRINGPLITRFENALNGGRERNNLYSEEAQWVPQYVLENVLREHAASLPGVEIRFNTDLRSLQQPD